MENDNKQCRYCRYLDRYYTKENKTFRKTDCGWCCNKVSTVKVEDGCCDFKRKIYHRKLRFGVQHYLDDILTQLSALRVIIEEDNESDNEVQKLQ